MTNLIGINTTASRLPTTRWAMRFIVATAILAISYTGFNIKHAYATTIRDIPDQIRLVDSPAFSTINYYPPLFGTDEQSNTNLEVFTKWTGVFDRLKDTINEKNSEQLLRDWKESLQNYKGLGLFEMAQKVNSLINTQKYIIDSKSFGKSDYWATPVEFFANGGDCEDFAIAKYMSLRALGVPEERIRVVLLHDNEKNSFHVVLVLYTDEGPMMLDNQIKDVRLTTSVTHYQPIFSLNQDTWWIHNQP